MSGKSSITDYIIPGFNSLFIINFINYLALILHRFVPNKGIPVKLLQCIMNNKRRHKVVYWLRQLFVAYVKFISMLIYFTHSCPSVLLF